MLYEEAGWPRTWVKVGEGPGALGDRVLAAVLRRETSVSAGPFVEMTVDGAPIGAVVAPKTKGKVKVRVKVQAPAWIPVEKVEIWRDGRGKDGRSPPNNWKSILGGSGWHRDEATGQWYWVVEFAGFWDKTIPIPGEDEDGMVDGNPLIRTRPPGWAIAAGHRFTGYAEDGVDWYTSIHCDMDDPTRYCWKDAPPQGNPSLKEPSLRDNIAGTWHVQYTISPTGVVHYNDYNGWDATGFTISFWINANGTWATQGYRAYQQPTPTESGWWESIHDASRDEEIVTFYRQNGRPAATIRIHAAKGVLTLFAVEGGASMQSFLKGVPADNNPKDDPQILLHPGVSYFNAPHAPFPGSHRCNTCP
mgnify:CR=1 FL=1